MPAHHTIHHDVVFQRPGQSMKKIDLQFEHFNLSAAANQLIQDCTEAGAEIAARASGQGDIPRFVSADGRVSWNVLNSVVRQEFPDNKPVFCEWGSGLGLVTMLASLIGMPATGIEIEEELIDLAQDFSRQFAIPASFINASIYPKDNPDLSIDYKNVDLFFAYPWPNEITQMTKLFSEVGVSGAILVVYHGGRNYRVLRL